MKLVLLTMLFLVVIMEFKSMPYFRDVKDIVLQHVDEEKYHLHKIATRTYFLFFNDYEDRCTLIFNFIFHR